MGRKIEDVVLAIVWTLLLFALIAGIAPILIWFLIALYCWAYGVQGF